MRFEIKNRKGLKIVGDVLIPEKSVGLSFVLHGLGGFRTQSNPQAIAQTFLKNNYTVVIFDATNSIGDSEGKYEDATTQTFQDDFEDVVEWSKSQPWYQEPFLIAGHSRGGYSIVHFAETNPSIVKGVFAFAPFISGKLHLQSKNRFKPEELKKWKETGWEIRSSTSKPDLELRLPYSFMEEAQSHDLVEKISNLTMPVLVIVGENDTSHPIDQQQLWYDLIPGPKELHIISGAPHTFRTEEHLAELSSILDTWIKSLQ